MLVVCHADAARSERIQLLPPLRRDMRGKPTQLMLFRMQHRPLHEMRGDETQGSAS